MNCTDKKSGFCPSKEDLSGWYDNGGDETVATHVGTCRTCDETVVFYKKVDETVRFVATPPTCLKSQILDSCHGLESEVLQFPLWIRVLRIAAVAAVVATVAGAVHLVTSGGMGEGAPTVVDKGARDLGEAPRVMAEIGLPSLNQAMGSETVAPRTEGVVRLNDLVAVSTGGERHIGPLGGVRPVVSIGQLVRHVWTVDDLADARQVFVDMLPASVVPELSRQVGEDKYFFEALLTDEQLQTLVDGLKNRGWSLVTKDFPQPGEEAKVSLTGRVVRYAVDLVGKSD